LRSKEGLDFLKNLTIYLFNHDRKERVVAICYQKYVILPESEHQEEITRQRILELRRCGGEGLWPFIRNTEGPHCLMFCGVLIRLFLAANCYGMSEAIG
jgi:hypothetical protein